MLPHDLAGCLTIISELGMPMKEPPQPGLSASHGCMGPTGLGVTEAICKFRTSRKQLSGMAWHRWKICPEMAIGPHNAVGEEADQWDWLASTWTSEQTKKGAHHTKVEQLLPTT